MSYVHRNTRGRPRKIDLTDHLKDQILHFDRLSPGTRKRVAYEGRILHDRSWEVLEWIYTKMPESFKRMRDRKVYYPLEVLVPRDPKKVKEVLDQLREWRETIEWIEKAVLETGVDYMRRGRI